VLLPPPFYRWISLFIRALTLQLVGWHEGHLACKNLAPAVPKGSFLED